MIRPAAIALTALLFLPASLPATAQDLDIDAVFNCSADGPLGDQTPEQCLAARTLMFNNCTSCHSFVPIVKAQKNDAAWTSLLDGHRERVLHMSDDDFKLLGDFLRSHFNDTQPVPQLPPALEQLGTNQPA
jgi:hypothetical protein